jgi:uncharacterized protein YqiB (DUF1249 family)
VSRLPTKLTGIVYADANTVKVVHADQGSRLACLLLSINQPAQMRHQQPDDAERRQTN